MNHRIYTLHARTPLHPGTGQGEGLVDLPIARERGTNHPILPGSSLKGVLRAAASSLGDDKEPRLSAHTVQALFGPDTDHAHEHAGALRFSDARVLLFPVQSDRGTFAWVTCPFALSRLRRDAGGALRLPDVPRLGDDRCAVGPNSALGVRQGTGATEVILDGLPFSPDPTLERDAAKWATALAALAFAEEADWRTLFSARLCLIPDDSFTWFVEHATEVRAHIRLDPNTGTVAMHALWYEESLPAETVMSGLVQLVHNTETSRLHKDGDPWADLAFLGSDLIQVGGKASTGQGVVALQLSGGGA